MKKGWKIFWLSCAVVAGIGFIFCIAGVAMGATTGTISGYFPNGIGIVDSRAEAVYENGQKGEHIETSESFSDIRELHIDVSGVAVQILKGQSAGNEIRIEAEGVSPRLDLNWYVDEDGLNIETNHKIRHMSYATYGTVWIYIPEDLEEAELDVRVGELYIQDIRANDLSVDAGAGEVTIDNFDAQEVDFSCGVGLIQAVGTFAGDADIDCGVGEIDLTVGGAETDYNYDVRCGIGEVTVGGMSFDGFVRNRSIQNNAPQDINIDCGIGEVTLAFGGEL